MRRHRILTLFLLPLLVAVAAPRTARGDEDLYRLGEAAAPCAELRRSPRVSAGAKQCLAPGTPVRVLRSFEDWRRVRLDDGSKGWLPASVLVPSSGEGAAATAQSPPAAPDPPATAAAAAVPGGQPEGEGRTRVLVPLAYEQEEREAAEEQRSAEEEQRGAAADLSAALAAAEALNRELEAELQASRQRQRELRERLARAEGALSELRERAADAPPAPPAAPAAEAADARPANSQAPDVLPMVEAWAAAWSEQRVEDYLAFYAPGFRPPGGESRVAWEATRRRRLAAPDYIRVTLSSLGIRPLGGERASVRFTQRYESDSYEDMVRKRLELVRIGGAWKIAEEITESQ